VDTEVMLGVVGRAGHVIADTPDDADVLVVNTCGFIESAKEESIDAVLELAEIKRRAASDKTLVVAGCLSQRHPEELADELPEVDHFLGSADMLSLGSILAGEAPRMAVSGLGTQSYLYDHATPRELIGNRSAAYVKIAEGCDRPCSFCTIPELRGPQRSRTISSIVREVSSLVERGTREICLLAQDLTAYGSDLGAPADLESLLDALVQIDELRWIRLHYAYPSTVTDGLLHRIGHEPKVATYLDVPIQHVDSEVLRRMRRGYSERHVRDLVERMRDPAVVGPSHLWFRTTLLVGHPGETTEAFEKLRDFVADGEIDHLGVFCWSREEGTSAAMQPGRVDRQAAQERAGELLALHADLRLRRNEALIGKPLAVFVDGLSADSDLLLEGRHEGQAPAVDGRVILTDGSAQPGDMVEAVVTQVDAYDLVASLDIEAHRELDDEA
jgi:ribosomal protein S12 methylthiotransferase